nr:hypothetical protein [Tanacetum cinerariifolium]
MDHHHRTTCWPKGARAGTTITKIRAWPKEARADTTLTCLLTLCTGAGVPGGDPEEDDDEDPKEDPADYPADSTVVALPTVDHVPSEEIPESCLPLWKRLHFASLTPSQEVGESSTVGAARQDEPTGVNQRVTDLSTVVEQETTIIVVEGDHKRQVQLTKALRLLKGLQTQMIEFQKHHRPAKGLAQPDALGEAGSSS